MQKGRRRMKYIITRQIHKNKLIKFIDLVRNADVE